MDRAETLTANPFARALRSWFLPFDYPLSPATPLPLRHRLALGTQVLIGRLSAWLYAPVVTLIMRLVMRYRFRDLRQVRRRFAQIRADHPGPLLICPNHLTMVDSAIVAWALAPTRRYLTDYAALPWNVPEQTNFANPFLRVFCYLAKCLPIRRGGSRQSQQAVMAKCAEVMRRGEPVLVFPEGRRSRRGGVDTEAMADGVGRLIKAVPGCKVLCVYLRGDGQDAYSALPRRGERFYVDLSLIEPSATGQGIRATRELTTAVLEELLRMEELYRVHRQRRG